MKKLVLFCLSACIVALTSCGSGAGTSGGSGSTGGVIPPVSAQTTYSTASLSGTYALTWWTFNATLSNAPYNTAVGTLQLNGSGAITGGAITVYTPNAPFPCPYNITGGSYSLQATTLGTATVTMSGTKTNCPPTDTWQLAIVAADGGAAFQISRTDTLGNGSAIKQ